MLIICRDTANSDKSLIEICQAKKYLPKADTVLTWLAEGNEHSQNYARVKLQQMDFLAHQIIEIADTEENPNKAKNMIDARKWLCGKLHPKKYGDRLELNGSIETPQRDIASLETALAISAVCKRIMEKAQLLEHKE
jgi:hypothetical protein